MIIARAYYGIVGSPPEGTPPPQGVSAPDAAVALAAAAAALRGPDTAPTSAEGIDALKVPVSGGGGAGGSHLASAALPPSSAKGNTEVDQFITTHGLDQRVAEKLR